METKERSFERRDVYQDLRAIEDRGLRLKEKRKKTFLTGLLRPFTNGRGRTGA